MSVHRLQSYETSLDGLFREVSALDDGDINKAHLTRYLCVRTSGYLEVVIRYLIGNLCDGTSPQPVKNFVQQRSKFITNLTYSKMQLLLCEFNENWGQDFTNLISDQQKSSMNSVVANRNNIAHGNSDNTSFREMTKYYADVKDIVVILKTIIKK